MLFAGVGESLIPRALAQSVKKEKNGEGWKDRSLAHGLYVFGKLVIIPQTESGLKFVELRLFEVVSHMSDM